MQIEIRLRKLLMEYGLDHRGISTELARDLGCHRHTIGALYRGDPANPSFALLTQLVAWLRRKGVPGEVLPQALFGLKPDHLWEAVARTNGVALYVAEYLENHDGRNRRWVSRRDAVLSSAISDEIYSGFYTTKPPAIHTDFVPFHFGPSGPIRPGHLKEDSEEAKKAPGHLQKEGTGCTSIIIGSQEVNYLLECWVADLFGCEPFKRCQNKPAVPMYFCSRNPDGSLESCFGGDQPPGLKGEKTPGLYYMTRKDSWDVYPFKPDGADAGAVLVVHEPSTNTIQMAIFGYSGRATEAMASRVVREAGPFWPPAHDVRGKKIGLYACRLDLDGPEAEEHPAIAAAAGKMDSYQISSQVLRTFF